MLMPFSFAACRFKARVGTHTVGYVVSSVVTKRQSLTNSWMNGLKWIKGRSTNVRIEVKWFCVRIWLWIPVLSLAGCYIKLPSSGSQLSRLLSSDAGTLGWSDPVSHDCGSFVECGPTIMPHSPAKPIFRLHVISSVHTHMASQYERQISKWGRTANCL